MRRGGAYFPIPVSPIRATRVSRAFFGPLHANVLRSRQLCLLLCKLCGPGFERPLPSANCRGFFRRHCTERSQTLKRCGHLIGLQLVYPSVVEHQSVSSVMDSENVPASFEMAETRWSGEQ